MSRQKKYTKIIPRIFGGLGNQLFIYAAARRLAMNSNAELVLDHVSGFVRDHDYQRHYQLDHFHIPCRKATTFERLEPFPRVRRAIKRSLNLRRPFAERNYIQQEIIVFDPRLLSVRPRGTLYLEGYWQSEKYFKNVETVIRGDLRIIPPMDEFNQAMARKIYGCRAVAVHVRLFDAPHEDGSNCTPQDYYTRAIDRMESIVSDAHYFVFSDQPSAARFRIPLPDYRITMVDQNIGDENAYADLWLMTRCQHFIIANSTFSWWGAWLAGYADKQIIAPGVEIRQAKMWWGFDGLLPAEWIKL